MKKNRIKDEPQEAELKYIIESEKDTVEQTKIIDIFLSLGYKYISTNNKVNSDDYYDTRDLSYYKSDCILRRRKIIKNGVIVYKGTYKSPKSNDEVYCDRVEIEEVLKEDNFDTFIKTMHRANSIINFNDLVESPIINIKNNRTDLVFDKEGMRMCVSLDDCIYTNLIMDNTIAKDRMIEIESIGIFSKEQMESIDKSMKEVLGLRSNKQSKYTRALNKTDNKKFDDIVILCQKLKNV